MKIWYMTGKVVPDNEVLVISGQYRFLPDERWYTYEGTPRYVALCEDEEGTIETDDLEAIAKIATILGVEE